MTKTCKICKICKSKNALVCRICNPHFADGVRTGQGMYLVHTTGHDLVTALVSPKPGVPDDAGAATPAALLPHLVTQAS